ncbi:serine threonine-protein kinase [Colletotrichum incanum]|nr:serine threonine-protein kinase [Colletotrichum incanum]
MPAGSVLALKMFVPSPASQSPTSSRMRSEIYATILREIKAFSSFSLKDHENIAQLRFIAWHKDQTFPMLAIELGNYGTLDYVIRSRGSSSTLSLRQKQHVTLDIAVGLRDVHRSQLIHGDLKPENIIIKSHPDPDREIVAKLLDFGGSSDDAKGGPLHFSPLWCAPEVVSKHPDRKRIDWRKCDVYSYGLVAASIWGRESSDKLYGEDGLNSHLQTSILSDFTTADGSADEKETDLLMELRHMQLLDWRNANSLTSILRTQLVAKLMPNSLDTPHLVGVVLSALRADITKRPTADELVPMLAPFFTQLGRDILPVPLAPPIPSSYTEADSSDEWSSFLSEQDDEDTEIVCSQESQTQFKRTIAESSKTRDYKEVRETYATIDNANDETGNKIVDRIGRSTSDETDDTRDSEMENESDDKTEQDTYNKAYVEEYNEADDEGEDEKDEWSEGEVEKQSEQERRNRTGDVKKKKEYELYRV